MYSEPIYDLETYVTLELLGSKYDQNFGSGVTAGYERQNWGINLDKNVCQKENVIYSYLIVAENSITANRPPYINGLGLFCWCIAGQCLDLYTLTRCKFFDLFESRRT